MKSPSGAWDGSPNVSPYGEAIQAKPSGSEALPDGVWRVAFSYGNRQAEGRKSQGERAPLRPEGLGGVSILPPSPSELPFPPTNDQGCGPEPMGMSDGWAESRE